MPRRIPRFCLRARVSKGLVTYVISPVPDSFPPRTTAVPSPSFFVSYPLSLSRADGLRAQRDTELTSRSPVQMIRKLRPRPATTGTS